MPSLKMCCSRSSRAHEAHVLRCSSISRLRARSSSPSEYPWSNSALSLQTTLHLLVARGEQRLAQSRPAARQARHHRADGNIPYLGDLLVREAFQFAQDKSLAESHRKSFQCFCKHELLY